MVRGDPFTNSNECAYFVSKCASEFQIKLHEIQQQNLNHCHLSDKFSVFHFDSTKKQLKKYIQVYKVCHTHTNKQKLLVKRKMLNNQNEKA